VQQALLQPQNAAERQADASSVHIVTTAGPQSAVAYPTALRVHVSSKDASAHFTSLGANAHLGETSVAYTTLRLAQHITNTQARALVQQLQASADAALSPEQALPWRPRRIQWCGPLLVGKPLADSRTPSHAGVDEHTVDAAAYQADGFRVIMCKVFFDVEDGARGGGWQKLLPELHFELSCNHSMPELLSLPGHDPFTVAEVAALRKGVPLYCGATAQQHLQCLGSTADGKLVPPAAPYKPMAVPPLCFAATVCCKASRRLAAAAAAANTGDTAREPSGFAGTVTHALRTAFEWLSGVRSYEVRSAFESAAEFNSWLGTLLDEHNETGHTKQHLHQLRTWLISPVARRSGVCHAFQALFPRLPVLATAESAAASGAEHSSATWAPPTQLVQKLMLACSSVDTLGLQGRHSGLHCTLEGFHLPSLLQPLLSATHGTCDMNRVSAPVMVLGVLCSPCPALDCVLGGLAAIVSNSAPLQYTCDTERGQLYLQHMGGSVGKQRGVGSDSMQGLLFCVSAGAGEGEWRRAREELATVLQGTGGPLLPLLVAICGVGGGGAIPDIQAAASALGLGRHAPRTCGMVHVAAAGGRGLVSGLQWLREASPVHAAVQQPSE